MKLKSAVLNVVVVVMSLVVAALSCEVIARVFLNPANYLSVSMVADDVLGMHVAPGSAGFDDWGFRNSKVPPSADVVAIGDSHTFGNTAAMSDAWPSVVGRLTGLSVYNMGMGGYGPNQYFELFRTHALALHPKWVICGLYMGDDFENAFSVTYGLKHWAFLRSGQWKHVNADIWDVPEPKAWYKGVTNLLSAHSIVYRLVVHGPVLGGVKSFLQFRRAMRNQDPLTTVLNVPSDGILEAFRPTGMVPRLDPNSTAVAEGMSITFRLLGDMANQCHQRGCQFAVVVIPTKESVFAGYLDADVGLHLHDSLVKTISNEQRAREKLFDFLNRAGIPYVDALPELRGAVRDHLYAATPTDMHPGKNGYAVIGRSVAAFLDKQRDPK
jgi:hypothetical protein